MYPAEEDGEDAVEKDGVDKGLGAEGEEESDEIEIPDEEVQPLRAEMPTKAEMAHHRVSHLPYRSWCPECVEGFAREWPHKAQEVERTIPLISCDYLYITEKGVFSREEPGALGRRKAGSIACACHV